MHHNRATDRLEHILSAIAPASGGLVMGTEIVWIARSLDHRETLSRISSRSPRRHGSRSGCCSPVARYTTANASTKRRARQPR
jgi:hypothetical protein